MFLESDLQRYRSNRTPAIFSLNMNERNYNV